MRKVLLNWLAGDHNELYVVTLTETDWNTLKLSDNHFVGEYIENPPENYEEIERAMCTVNLAMQRQFGDVEEWAEEVGIDKSWIGRFAELSPVTGGPLCVDEVLCTGYFA